MGKHSGTNSGLGGFVNGGSIRFAKLKSGTGGVDAWRDQLVNARGTGQSGNKRSRTVGTKVPKLYTVHEAHVVSMQSYGAFVQLGKGDTYKDGMLHVSMIGPGERHRDGDKATTPEEGGLEMGIKIWVKVCDISETEFKYSLDMRYVSQGDGTDLDPYNNKTKMPDNQWYRGSFAKFAPKDEPEDDAPMIVAPSSPKQSSSSKRKAESSESDGTSISSDVGKKLKKARKKLEKMKKKAEKVQKKEMKKSKKSKKKKGSDSDEDPCPSSRSS